MPVSIVVGGQFGSEGKGKVALEIARRSKQAVTAVRVGGPNSGHTAYDKAGKRWALRQMPAASVDLDVDVVFPPGSYLDIELLLREIDQLNFPIERVKISRFSKIIVDSHKTWERQAGLIDSIGSTGTGVGAAVLADVARGAANFGLPSPRAEEFSQLQDLIVDSTEILAQDLRAGKRVIVEGTQGYGLSLPDGGYWPKATARGTTAAAALAESGLSPIDVDDITLVIRSFPIRVAGDSGPLPGETTWEKIALDCGGKLDLREYTTVTKRLRRVGGFDSILVRRAIMSNNPTRIVLNHLDYVGSAESLRYRDSRPRKFLEEKILSIGRPISWVGFSPESVEEYEETVL